MTKTSIQKVPLPCSCQNCLCRRGARCRCRAYNALLALAFGGFGLMGRRNPVLKRARP